MEIQNINEILPSRTEPSLTPSYAQSHAALIPSDAYLLTGMYVYRSNCCMEFLELISKKYL